MADSLNQAAGTRSWSEGWLIEQVYVLLTEGTFRFGEQCMCCSVSGFELDEQCMCCSMSGFWGSVSSVCAARGVVYVLPGE